MLFWALTALLVLAVALPMVATILRARRHAGEDGESAPGSDLAVYRDQLREVERDLSRGVIAEGEAERLRTEVSRRLLSADTAARKATRTGRAPRTVSLAAAVVLGLGLLGGAYALYGELGAPGYGDLSLADRIAAAEELRQTRPAQAAAEERRGAADTGTETPEDGEYAALMDRLRGALAERPDDLRGHLLLAENEAALGNFVAARQAQARAIGIKGDEATAADFADLAEYMIQAAGGYVSPEAEQALGRALQRDSDNGIARFYSGLMMGQIGRPDIGFRIWRELLNDSAPGDPWVAPLRARIEEMADRAGARYTLPEAGDTRGPSQADIAAASGMDPEDRQEMIRGMVEGLASRLGSEGGTPDEWARLIGALGVLGETERAREIWEEARLVFAGDETALSRIAAQAEQAGLTE